jgi:hypothetical protein
VWLLKGKIIFILFSTVENMMMPSLIRFQITHHSLPKIYRVKNKKKDDKFDFILVTKILFLFVLISFYVKLQKCVKLL